MQAIECSLPGVTLIVPKRHGDARGWFSETFRENWFRENVADVALIQDNHAASPIAGTLRGLHLQLDPHAQAKLVRCIAGAIWDVAVDVRPGSPTLGQWLAEELTAENGHQLFVPAGYAHGYVTLTPNTEVLYSCSAYYAPEADRGIAWNDPTLAIDWPLPADGPMLSDKDTRQSSLAEFLKARDGQ